MRPPPQLLVKIPTGTTISRDLLHLVNQQSLCPFGNQPSAPKGFPPPVSHLAQENEKSCNVVMCHCGHCVCYLCGRPVMKSSEMTNWDLVCPPSRAMCSCEMGFFGVGICPSRGPFEEEPNQRSNQQVQPHGLHGVPGLRRQQFRNAGHPSAGETSETLRAEPSSPVTPQKTFIFVEGKSGRGWSGSSPRVVPCFDGPHPHPPNRGGTGPRGVQEAARGAARHAAVLPAGQPRRGGGAPHPPRGEGRGPPLCFPGRGGAGAARAGAGTELGGWSGDPQKNVAQKAQKKHKQRRNKTNASSVASLVRLRPPSVRFP